MQRERRFLVSLLVTLALLAAGTGFLASSAQAGFGDQMKEKACVAACDTAKNKCEKKCTDPDMEDACKLTCSEARQVCADECKK